MKKFFRMGEKAQESAPFELLIAVILMGFVLLVGYNAITQLKQQQCTSLIDAELNQLATSLENTTSGKGSSQFQFSLGECAAKVSDCQGFSANAGSKDIQCIRLIDSVDPYICSNFCSSARDACSLIQYESAQFQTQTKCVDISPSTVFPDSPGSQCPDRTADGYQLLNLNTEVKQGTYSLVKANSLTAAQPIVCAYVQCRTPNCA
ncbi:MAG: hypothetical protein IPJ89_03520 [Candidatus Iainarchaeum archaeon]|uniref:Class III signal peptide-containing protein n=1 Tax=Candidatus Iainarchaeum sp. TaxID=3101447 RepID=A0A7T9DJ53_9ARCH|nr:MAG: hypothetical protein IPJ89_03520 [Candidatus Diapherotrites archaeon]